MVSVKRCDRLPPMPRPDLWRAPQRPRPPVGPRITRLPRQGPTASRDCLVDLLEPPDEETQLAAIARELRRPDV